MQRQSTNSPKYQSLPFTHNDVQAFFSSKEPISNHQMKPSSKPHSQLIKAQQSLEKLKQTNLSFLKKKTTLEDASPLSTHNTNNNHINFYAKNLPKHHQHNASVKSDIGEKLFAQAKKVASLGQDENFKTIQLTPNSRLREALQKNQSSQKSNQHSSPNIQVRPYPIAGLCSEYNSLQSTSQKRTALHQTSGSVNFSFLQQQLNTLNKKAESALKQQGTPSKFINEHSKSRSVAEQKENYFSLSNLSLGNVNLITESRCAIKSPQNNQNYKVQLSSPIISESIGSQDRMMCYQHMDKKAKYINEQDGSYYCSRCAVNLAHLGIKTQELTLVQDVTVQSQQIQSQILQSLKVSKQCVVPQVENIYFDTQQYKEQEMTKYFTQLEQNQLQCDKLTEILKQQLEQVEQYYEVQNQQCQNFHSQLLSCLTHQYQQSLKTITTQMTKSIQDIQQQSREFNVSKLELGQIYDEIKNNWKSIVDHIEIGPFKEIMLYNEEKLKNIQKQMKVMMNDNIKMVSLPATEVYHVCKQITESFELDESSIPMIPSEYQQQTQSQIKEEPFFGQPIRTQPTPTKSNQIAFTPTRLKTDISEKKSNTNFFQYFFEKQQEEPVVKMSGSTTLKESLQSCRAVASNSVHNQLYISFENRDIFHNAMEKQFKEEPAQKSIMVLQSYDGSKQITEEEDIKSSHSTPHSPASGQTKSQYERVSTTQQVKLIPQQPDVNFQKNKQTFRTLFETQPDDDLCSKEKEREVEVEVDKDSCKVSPAKSDKFKQFLDKVNNNQSKTQQFYQNFIQTIKTTSSPRYEQISFDENDEDREVQTVFQSRELGSTVKHQSSQKKWHSSSKNNELSVPSDSSQSSDQNGKIRDPYQKTLFCSPTFKNDGFEDLNISQSDEE